VIVSGHSGRQTSPVPSDASSPADATPSTSRAAKATRAARAARARRPRLFLALGLLLALGAAAALWIGISQGGDESGTSPARPGQRPRTEGPSPGAEQRGEPTALTPARGLLLGAPVYDGDFADPFVLAAGTTLYAYATNTEDANLPVIQIREQDRNKGTFHGDAFPTLPAWSTPGRVWAPAVYDTGEHFVLYYTTEVTATGRQCVSRAVADSPLGPFVDDSTEPFVCQDELGGTIDPSIVIDADDRAWLLFKNDGNCCGLPTSLWSARLTADGLDTEGTYHELLGAEHEWEAELIEAPSMLVDRGTYYLFYSANAWDTSKYAVGYATCESLRGPCTRSSDEPWMSSSAFARGPGGQEFFAAFDRLWMVYAAWERGSIGYPQGERRLYLDLVDIEDGEPRRLGARGASLLLVFVIGIGVAAASGGVLWVRHRRRRRRRHEEQDASDDDEMGQLTDTGSS